jgi:signal transduction histidine kinase
MKDQWNIFMMFIGWLCLQVVLNGAMFFVWSETFDSAFALTDTSIHPSGMGQTKRLAAANEPERRPLPNRMPPQEAFDACNGKKEGEACTFRSPEGLLDGECHAGVENWFACRPHRGPPTSEALKSPTPGQHINPSDSSQPGNRPQPRTDREPARQVESSPGQVPSNLVSPPEKELPGREIQAGPALKTEYPPSPPTSPGFYSKLMGNAGLFASYLVVAIIAVGLTWYAFFKYSTGPLRRLRKVTQQLAGGNLSARVGEGLVPRKDEVADLGRDVDLMAERIESLVGAQQRLIRDVSHELRSPLSRLNVALELARQSAGPTLSVPFDRIERESDRLNELISQLLMLTKLENESTMAQRTDFDIAALIGEVAQDADFEARNNDRRIITTELEPIIVNGNQELLRQTMENLVRNAARYTATGTAVEISLRKIFSTGRDWAHIEVRDHGPGVPEAALKDIFRPFYRVNDARERQSGGAGVGLAIADRAVRLHGGGIRAFNAPDVGLVMEIELPLKYK